jgi:hypothetical protein
MLNPTFIKRSILGTGIASLLTLITTATNSSYAGTIKFNTWNFSGDVTTPADGEVNLSNSSFGFGDDFDYKPSNPDAYNYTQSQSAIEVDGTLENFLGLIAGDLDIGGTAFQGSAISTSLTVTSGDKFSFKWNFLTNETASQPPFSPLNDFAFFVVNGVVIKLADVNDASNISSFFNSETGENIFSYTFTNAGNYKLGIGVIDIDDFANTSALQIRQANIEGKTQSIPERSIVIGLCVTITFGMIFKGKRSRKNLS